MIIVHISIILIKIRSYINKKRARGPQRSTLLLSKFCPWLIFLHTVAHADNTYAAADGNPVISISRCSSNNVELQITKIKLSVYIEKSVDESPQKEVVGIQTSNVVTRGHKHFPNVGPDYAGTKLFLSKMITECL